MQQDELIGTTLGSYRILASLGQGGMARVYKAYQENLDREVAIKVLPPWYATDRSFVERFNLEARLVARLSHPNIVTVHDANEQNGHLYIVMQLVSGGTLKQRLDQLQQQRRVMDTVEVVQIFAQLADALSYAHEQGIIHRDIKPVNVLMDRSGRPILSDFGIAKVLASTQEGLTRPGAGVGTPEYMSPEQCQGGAVDGRADIYALGIMLFEAMAGRTPFQGDNYPALAHQHIYEPPPRPCILNPGINPVIERVILTAIMKKPQQRYQRASDMAEALHQALVVNTNVPESGYFRQTPGSSLNGQRFSAPLETVYPCLYCGKPNKAQIRFCTKCGTPTNPCSLCGTTNPVSNRFCYKCGQPLTQQI
jgi:serine/threonine protein kinase